MDEYCAKLANTISGRVYQARNNTDALKKGGDKLYSIIFPPFAHHRTYLKVTNLKKHTEHTPHMLQGVLSSIEQLDSFLKPEERLDHPDIRCRFVFLFHPSYERK